MLAQEKIRRYLRERKRPVTAEQIALHFLLNTSTVRRALNELQAQGYVTAAPAHRPSGQPISVWSYCHETAPKPEPEEIHAPPECAPPVPVAVSKPPAKPQPSRPAPVVWPTSSYSKPQTSYPNVRGYDD